MGRSDVGDAFRYVEHYAHGHLADTTAPAPMPTDEGGADVINKNEHWVEEAGRVNKW